MKNLKDREDIVITNADKGGAVVILNKDDYQKEATRQLSDKSSYKKLASDPTSDHVHKVKQTLNELQESHFISKKMAEGLIPEKVKTPNFYMLPKVHKPDNPGRPVISSVNCHTSEISRFVDHKLQPEVRKLDSYVQDTTDFIKKISKIKSIPKGAYLVTMDVRSLYTSIPNEEGLQAVEQTLIESNRREEIPIVLRLLNLVLTLNNFIFNNEHFLQIKGCAMGTICAPSYANIFMGRFESRHT